MSVPITCTECGLIVNVNNIVVGKDEKTLWYPGQEDFEKFISGINEAIEYINEHDLDEE